ncbi:hypothetical protein J4477_03890 [Candidatus Pacearchaeota archaeon]|nr:hypothetical protein [Candidatus Pacearchaeota archaeon]
MLANLHTNYNDGERVAELFEKLEGQMYIPTMTGRDFFGSIQKRIEFEWVNDPDVRAEYTNGNEVRLPAYVGQAYRKFIDDEKLFESERRSRMGHPFKSYQESIDATLKALTSRAIDFFKDSKLDANGVYQNRYHENLRCPLNPWFG